MKKYTAYLSATAVILLMLFIRYSLRGALPFNVTPFSFSIIPLIYISSRYTTPVIIYSVLLSFATNTALTAFHTSIEHITQVVFISQSINFLLVVGIIVTLNYRLFKTQRKLKEHTNYLEIQGRQKDEFISMASHELKTPITSMKMYVQAVKKRLKTKDKVSYEHLHKVETQINTLTDMINDFLDVSRIKTGKITYMEERFCYQTLIKEVIDEVQQVTRYHRVILEGSSRRALYGDRKRIKQVLTNLLSNAIKYSPGKSRVYVRVSNNTEAITTKVTDFGIGISEEDRTHIFDQFYQAHRNTNIRFTGLGLGLFISCEIVKHHQGMLWVESEVGKGSTFFLKLPIKRDE